MRVINLWGAPSSGKSTTAAGLFFLMKINKYKVELVTEYAKDLAWDMNYNKKILGLNSQIVLNQSMSSKNDEHLPALPKEQIDIFAEQKHRLVRLEGEVDYVITDSPLPLSVFYMSKNYYTEFPTIVFEQFNKYENINFFLNRKGEFENFGRIHNESQSVFLAKKLQSFLEQNNISYKEIDATPNSPNEIFQEIVPQPLKLKVPDHNNAPSFEVITEKKQKLID